MVPRLTWCLGCGGKQWGATAAPACQAAIKVLEHQLPPSSPCLLHAVARHLALCGSCCMPPLRSGRPRNLLILKCMRSGDECRAYTRQSHVTGNEHHVLPASSCSRAACLTAWSRTTAVWQALVRQRQPSSSPSCKICQPWVTVVGKAVAADLC